LEVLRQEEEYVFFKVAEGYCWHTQNLALFETGNRSFLENKSATLSPEGSTLQNSALKLALEDFEPEKQRLEVVGVKVQETEHAWIHVHSLYNADPEGNTLEFVAYDERVQ